MISQETIDAILERSDIVSIISEYIPLKKRGADYVCCCPFHQEKTPSFHVSPVRQSWHCFGACSEGGNVIHFLMKKEGLTFPEAIKNLASRCGIEIAEEHEDNEKHERRLKQEALWGINERVAAYYVSNLYDPANAHALSYATNRFGEDYVKEYGMGYAKEDNSLYVWARQHGESLDLLLEVGLIGRNEQEGSYYDFYRNRLLFPIRDKSKHIIGFTARDLSGTNNCKYLNSRESVAYQKKVSVFGIDEAFREAMRKEQFFLVEGAPDVLKMHSVGINNVVAPLGGAWTEIQLEQLKKFAPAVCFINDADPPSPGEEYGPGIKYVMKNGLTALKLGLKVSVREIMLGEGNTKQDPDSFFTSSTMLNHLTEEEFIGWVAKKLWNKNDNVHKRADIMTQIAEYASYIKDEMRLEMIIDELIKLRKGREMWRGCINRVKWARINAEKKSCREVDLQIYGFMENQGCYYGLDDNGEKLWCNFTLRPLFHIYDNEKPRRLFEIKNCSGRKELLDLDMEELNSLAKFRKKLEGLGNFVWRVGENELIKLKSYLYENTETASLVTQMGWNPSGFYAFGNGIWVDDSFKVADQYGIVHTGEEKNLQFWFIPSAAQLGNNDATQYERQKKFVHRSLNHIRFGEYMEKFVDVYGDNGKIGLCYWLASLFRDIITSYTRSFPLLNLFGPKGSGKTELGAALMAFFVADNKAPNLKNSTPVALNDDVAYVCNALVHFDEYKNDLHPKMIEFLKGLYDGVGRTKMGGSSYGDRKMTAVKTGVIFSGQEIPTVDIALFHRCVFLSFQRSEFTLEERSRFAQLRTIQERGLTDMTLNVLEQRKRMQGQYLGTYSDVMNDITQATNNAPLETRIVENWAKILAAFRCLESKLQFPFTYNNVLQIGLQMMLKQNSMSGEGNELAHFWRTIIYLRDNGNLYEKGDYIIRTVKKFSSDIINNRIYSTPHQILLLNPSRVFTLYKETARRTGDRIIPDDALREYMKNTDYYLGILKSVRFNSFINGYEERREVTPGRMSVVQHITRAMAFDYEVLKQKYGISLDATTNEGFASEEEPSEDEEETELQQPLLPF